MADTGVIFKRCGCRNDAGHRLERSCARLAERGHGSWYFHCSAQEPAGPPGTGPPGWLSVPGGGPRARDEWLATTGEDRTARSWTVQRWLRYWLASRTGIRPTTKLHYTRDVERVLIPHLGRLCLADLDARRLRAAFADIAADHQRERPAAVGFGDAAPAHHPARGVEPRGPRRGDGHQPGPAHRGPRLPQAARPGVDRRPGRAMAAHRRAAGGRGVDRRPTGHVPGRASPTTRCSPCGGSSPCADCAGARRAGCAGPSSTSTTACCSSCGTAPPPATRSSRANRRPPPDGARSHWTGAPCRSCGSTAAARHSSVSVGSPPGRCGTSPDTCSSARTATRSTPATPADGSGSWSTRAGVPPIRLHDLRHGAASLAHEAGADLKTLQDLLGHSSIVITADTYTSVLPPAQRQCADATAKLVLAAARRTRDKIRKQGPPQPAQPRPSERCADPSQARPTPRSRRSRRTATGTGVTER